jgi:hypothetical protein
MSGLELILILNTTMIITNLTAFLIFSNNIIKGMKEDAHRY